MVRGETRTAKRAIERVEGEIAQSQEEATLADILARPPDETTTLHTATVADLHDLVAAGSVDAVITHPSHTEEALPLMSGLSAFGARVLGKHRSDGGGRQRGHPAEDAGAAGPP